MNDLFGYPIIGPAPVMPKDLQMSEVKAERMRKLFGENPEESCIHCKHFCCAIGRRRNFYKCRLYGISGGAATDWRRFYRACGKFERDDE
jgi:hypothetical protein